MSRHDPAGNLFRIWTFVLLAMLGGVRVEAATGILRIGTYNLEADVDGVTGPRAGLATVLEDIGAYSVEGDAQPLDILGLEETTSESKTVNPIVASLNSFYGGQAIYASTGVQGLSSGNNVTTGNGPNSLIYNTLTLKLLSAVGIGTPKGATNGEYRQIMRYEFQPVNGTPADDFYMYVEHYKSGTGSTNEALRNDEAAIVRADAATLGPNAHIIYSGDLNMPPGESGYTTLTAAGVGQAFDPLNGANSLSAFTDSSTSLKYRDDYELLTAPMFADPNGLEFISGSYTVFGNNGVSKSGTLSELQTASDHLPVFADYSFAKATVPEPNGGTLLGLAGAMLGFLRWRKAR